MRFKDLCIQPDNELDEKFIEEEMNFLIDVSIKKQNLYKNVSSYAAVVKQRYLTWIYETQFDG